ncbi:MAG: hypothetical protein A2Z18_10170 [Armatimonadetes bacterium RBG_16_58_9]|nr:MAG: hypothetical protein A2Z18_10170 [Armatimonadetes bacterium RBG_16_58_9]
MQTTSLADLELSQMMLGTVQFGLEYGIANKSGQPSYEAVRDIIACAYEAGVNCFDTAASYGTSEDVVGRALADLKITDKVVVATKIRHMADDLTAGEADAIVQDSVTDSIRRLRLDVLPICLFHLETNFLLYADSLLKMRDRGLVRHVGASVVTPEATTEILHSGRADALQIPTSILDMRFVRGGICSEAVERNTALFVRSVYLQGLLLMPEDEIPTRLAGVIPVRRALRSLADKAGIGLAELAVRYVAGLPGVTSLVLGVDSVDQMRENIELFSKGPLEPDVAAAVVDAVPDLPESIVSPRKWSG